MGERPSYNPETESTPSTEALKLLLSRESPYRDFLENMYKYADQVEITDVPREENRSYFERARAGNELLDEIVEQHQAAEGQSAITPEYAQHRVETLAEVSGFIDEESHLQKDRLIAMFEWSLKIWVMVGERFGRPATITEAEIPGYVECLSSVL